MSQELISTLVPIALIGFISLLVGAVVGFLLASLLGQTAPPEPKRPKSLSEAARLWRDRRSGKVSLEMDGVMLKSAAAMSAEQRVTLTQVVDELQLWLEAEELVTRALGGAPAGASSTASAAAPLPDPAPKAPADPPSAVATASAAAVLLPGEPEVKPPSLDVRDVLSRAFTQNTSKTAAKPVKSIAAQVDEIIQQRLPNSPLKNHLITMTDLPGAGLVVKIDGARYEGVGDVPDPEIRAFLRQCVAEWESRTESA